MALSVKHALVSSKADGVDPTLVQPSNWNAEHAILAGAQTLVGNGAQTTGAVAEIPFATFTGGANKIINGGMVLDQRNAGASFTPTASGNYTVDRWYANIGVTGKYSVQQNGGSLTAPAGYPNWLCVTSLSSYSVGASEAFTIAQAIEGLNVADLQWGTANAKAVTFSFLVQSTLTGTFGGSVQNSGHTRSYPFSYSIPVANTWTQVSITIPGDTSGTWLTTTGLGLAVYFSLGSGTTMSGTAATWASANYFAPTGAVSVVGTNGAKIAFTAVKLEPGTVSTPFQHDDYVILMHKCLRYLRTFGCNDVNDVFATGQALSATNVSAFLIFDEMRAAPTLNFAGATDFRLQNANATGYFPTTSASIDSPTKKSCRVNFICAGGLTAGNACMVFGTSGVAAFVLDAEL